MNMLHRVNPVTRILALGLLTTPLMLTIDWLSATIAIVFTLCMAPLCGVGLAQFCRRALPIVLLAPVAAVPMALYGQQGGTVYLSWSLITVSELSLSLAVAIALRVLAIALPVIVLSANVDPTDLGDGLAQILHLPERFVIGAVAAFRMLGLLREDLRAMRRSRRARGIADAGRVRYGFSLAFGLLVMSLRRAGKLATAMEARGFGKLSKRTWARTSRLHAKDWVVMAVCFAVAICALLVSYQAGFFRPVWQVS